MARSSVSRRWSDAGEALLDGVHARVEAVVVLQHFVAQAVASAEQFGAEVFDPVLDAVDPVLDAVDPVAQCASCFV